MRVERRKSVEAAAPRRWRWARRARALVVLPLLLAVLVLVAAGALGWRLSRGPISLDFLTPRIVAALAPPGGRVRFEIGHTEVAWAGWERGLDLRVRDVHVVGSAGHTIATLPAIAVELSAEGLLRGSFEPSEIDLLGPSLQLVRKSDGSFDLGVGGSADEPEGKSFLADLLSDLRSEGAGDSPASSLRRIAVTDGTLLVDDVERGEIWRAPDLDLSVTREDGATEVRLGGRLELASDQVAFRGHAHAPAGGGASVQVELSGIRPKAIASRVADEVGGAVAGQISALVPTLDRVDLVLASQIAVELDPSWRPLRVAVKLDSPAGRIPIGGATEAVRDLALEAEVDVAASSARLSRLSLVLGGAQVHASGALAGLGGGGSLELELGVKSLPIELAWRAWPKEAAVSARTWLTRNISRGAVSEVHVHFAAELPGPNRAGVSGVQVMGRVRYDGLRVRFLDTMPAVERVAGGGTFTQEGFDLGVERGSIEGVTVGPRARVVISGIDVDRPHIAIDAPVRGPLAGALTVLDAKPVEAAKALGIRPSDASGRMDGALRLAFPLGDDPRGLAGLGLHGRAQTTGAGFPDLFTGWSVADGDLQVEVDAKALVVGGRIAVEGAPVELSWTENLAPGVKRLRSLTVKGSLDAAARKRLGFDLEPWLMGPVGVTFDLEQNAGALAQARLNADLGPATIDVPQIAWRKPEGAPGKMNAGLSLDGEHLRAIDPFAIEAGGLTASGSAAHDPALDRWTRIQGNLSLAAGAARQAPGRAEVAVDGSASGYDLRLTSNDCGSLFRTIGLYADAVGGALVLTGTVRPEPDGLDFAGRFEIDDVTVTNAPLLARVAGLASFRGIADAFSPSGKGIAFEKLSADLEHAQKVVTIGNGVAAGTTLGLLLSGTIDQRADQVNLRGTLVPQLYGLNKLLGKIPVVNWAMSGREGGPIGVDFSLDGPARDPKVAVHPLDSVTPAILSRMVTALESGLGRSP